MKKRYSSAKPYGEWLAQELVTLEHIVRSVPESGEGGALPAPADGPRWLIAVSAQPATQALQAAAATTLVGHRPGP